MKDWNLAFYIWLAIMMFILGHMSGYKSGFCAGLIIGTNATQGYTIISCN